ncbi:restriction endonuclease subunit S [uncultured Acetatifactor sp.]|uniref:restriction endonuclease subunit S n=1 Tax=uncultured Acetatifactor sp. TaxID=1671927 RepID=UPI0026071542|nr:restriction endonuclease subunit S [uncultured Acetatifactor sp.]
MNHACDKLVWFGVVPNHWKVLKLRQILSPVSEKNHPDLPLLSVVREKGVIVRNIEDKEENHNYVPDDLSGYKLVKIGQFAMNKMKAWQGSYGVSRFDGIVSPAYFVFDIQYDINIDFFNRAIRSIVYVNYFGQASDGIRVGQWDLSMQRMKEIPFLLPPRPEQDQIVRFLDWKVSSVNKLIDVKQRQIGCLNERLLAVINDLLTRGVKNNRAYVKTNMDWASEIPLEWEISRVRNHFEILKRIAGSEGFDVFSVTQQGLKVRNINLYEGQLAANYSGYQFVYPGEFAMNHMDLLTGGVGIADHLGVTSPDYRVFRLFDEERCYAAYYLKIFQLCYRRHAFYRFGRGAANVGRWRLPASAFKNFEIPLPPYDEQIEIVRAIEIEEHKIKTVIDCLQQEIDVLKEFKKRLIADVVTGKIDVRGIEIPEYDLVEEDSDGESEENTESMEGEMDEE